MGRMILEPNLSDSPATNAATGEKRLRLAEPERSGCRERYNQYCGDTTKPPFASALIRSGQENGHKRKICGSANNSRDNAFMYAEVKGKQISHAAVLRKETGR